MKTAKPATIIVTPSDNLLEVLSGIGPEIKTVALSDGIFEATQTLRLGLDPELVYCS